MCDYDPPSSTFYDPEFPIESDGENRDDTYDLPAPCTSYPTSTVVGTASRSVSTKRTIPIEQNGPPVQRKKTRRGPRRSRWASKESAELFCARKYTRSDLYPSELDPMCYPAWALSPYWPVYVSNFLLNSLDQCERNVQVSTFFACQGLLTRMIFIRENDAFFQNHQTKTLLLDMLVYFTCKEDADRAMRCCDNTVYYGHKLRVFPGRVPLYFNRSRTVRFLLPADRSLQHTETHAENGFMRRGCGSVTTIVKHSECELIVEFDDQHSMNLAVMQSAFWMPSRLTEAVSKQRFLEQDCKYEMMFLIGENPGFIDMLPPEDVLKELLDGKIPRVSKDWEGWAFPKALPVGFRDSIHNEKVDREQEAMGSKTAMVGASNSVPRSDELINRLRMEVTQHKGIFFGKQRPEPSGKTTKLTPADHYDKHREKAENQQKWFEYKLDMIGTYGKVDSPGTIREDTIQYSKSNQHGKPLKYAEKKFLEKKKLFLTKRLQLLSKKKVTSLAIRNKLFFDLLRLEKWLGSKSATYDHHIDELKTGVIVAAHNTGLQQHFRKYYTHPPPRLHLSDIEEPLDKLWPVFVSNFFALDLNPKQRNQQIHDFFATEGLSVYMVYLDESDEFYKSYLKSIHLLDMLVYFPNQEDAKTAIRVLHGSTHLGHKLCIFPGREAIRYFNERAVFIDLDSDPVIGEASIQQYLSSADLPLEALEGVMRYPGKAIFFYAQKRQGRVDGLSKNVSKPNPRMQRFIEADVKADLLRRILRDADFLNDQPMAAESLISSFPVESLPPDGTGEVVWKGGYQERKKTNAHVGKVLVEWEKLQSAVTPSPK